MPELVVTALAALLAVVVYVLQNTVFVPIQEQRRLVGETAFVGTFYANVGEILRPEDAQKKDEARIAIRTLASQLRSTLVIIPMYPLWALIGMAYKKDAIMKASNALIGYSNSLGDSRSKEVHLKAIREALNIDW